MHSIPLRDFFHYSFNVPSSIMADTTLANLCTGKPMTLK